VQLTQTHTIRRIHTHPQSVNDTGQKENKNIKKSRCQGKAKEKPPVLTWLKICLPRGAQIEIGSQLGS